MVATHMLCAALVISMGVVASIGKAPKVVVVVVVVADDVSCDCVGSLTPNPATDGRRKETKQKDDTREYIMMQVGLIFRN